MDRVDQDCWLDWLRTLHNVRIEEAPDTFKSFVWLLRLQKKTITIQPLVAVLLMVIS